MSGGRVRSPISGEPLNKQWIYTGPPVQFTLDMYWEVYKWKCEQIQSPYFCAISYTWIFTLSIQSCAIITRPNTAWYNTQHCYVSRAQIRCWSYSISQEICTRFCFAVLCCGYTLTDFPISIRLTSLALWQSNDCPSASKATLMNMDKYFMWIHYELLHNHNKAKHNKTVCIFLGIYCTKYSIPRPPEQAVMCLLWAFLQEIDRVITAPHCIKLTNSIHRDVFGMINANFCMLLFCY